MSKRLSAEKDVVIVVFGQRGLTAAFELSKHEVPAMVLERYKQVGGIARTVNYKGYLLDIGDHRFFRKWGEDGEDKQIWNEVLGNKEWVAQRTKGLSLASAIRNVVLPPKKAT